MMAELKSLADTEEKEVMLSRKEFDFKLALIYQINRIGQLSATVFNIASSDAGFKEYTDELKVLSAYYLESAVSILENMLAFYLDEEIKKKLGNLEADFLSKQDRIDKETFGHTSFGSYYLRRDYAMTKFRILMEFMGKKGLLLEELGTLGEESLL
jgi:hypothetical protein